MNARVLVVDDNAQHRRHVSAMLSASGFEAALASSGAEALETLCDRRGGGQTQTSADLVLILTAHRRVDYQRVCDRAARVLDLRNATRDLANTARVERL